MRPLLLLALPAVIAAADPAQQWAAELVRARIPQDPARAATYLRIAEMLAAGRCTPADAVALLDLVAKAPAAALPADPASLASALDGEPAPAPAPAPAPTLAPPPMPLPGTASITAIELVPPASRPVIQALSGSDGRTVAVAVGSDGLVAGDRLRIERGDTAIAIAVVTRLQAGLALASVIPDTASGAVLAGDRAVPQIR